VDLKRIRDESIRTARQLGAEVSATLPLLDAGLEMRSVDETVCRILAMNAVAATAYGFDSAKVTAWLNQEALTNSLSEQERVYVFEGIGRPDRYQIQVEGMWALSWAMGIVTEMNFAQDCDSRFAAMLPNLKQQQTSAEFRKRANPRSLETVISGCDLAYCLHWAIRQAKLGGYRPPASLQPYVVVERRRALEWLLSTEAWDEVQLDT
jgi:uncharacterized protein DUF4272